MACLGDRLAKKLYAAMAGGSLWCVRTGLSNGRGISKGTFGVDLEDAGWLGVCSRVNDMARSPSIYKHIAGCMREP